MIMKILSTIVLLLTAVTLSAQPDAATCTGQTCTGQGSAIGFATVSFFSETDSSAVYGALADSTGRFSVRIPHGNYRMEIALLGYEKKQRGITIAHDTDLGRIVLDPSEISLQGVEVKAAPIVREADRFIVNVADMPQAIGRTAVEMLKLSPGVWIRDDIAIFGKKGAKVMINNRLLRETGEDLINYLNQIPAEDILRIEIVPNSGAEYDADMTAGIITEAQTRQRDRRSGRHLLFARLFKRFFDDFSVVQPELPERPVEPLRFDGNLVRQTDRTNYRIVRIRAKRRVDSLRKQARRALEIRFAAHRSAVRIQRPAQRRIGNQLLPQSARRIGNP